MSQRDYFLGRDSFTPLPWFDPSLRTWQNAAGTVPANTIGQTVLAWTTSLGELYADITATGGRTLVSSGGKLVLQSTSTAPGLAYVDSGVVANSTTFPYMDYFVWMNTGAVASASTNGNFRRYGSSVNNAMCFMQFGFTGGFPTTGTAKMRLRVSGTSTEYSFPEITLATATWYGFRWSVDPVNNLYLFTVYKTDGTILAMTAPTVTPTASSLPTPGNTASQIGGSGAEAMDYGRVYQQLTRLFTPQEIGGIIETGYG